MNCERLQISNLSKCPPLGTRGNNYASEQSFDVTEKANKSTKQDASSSGSDDNSPTGKVRANEYNSGDVRISSSGMQEEQTIGVGMFLGVFLPILLISCLAVWIFYAYRNPHTKSGQLLIQVSFNNLIYFD